MVVDQLYKIGTSSPMLRCVIEEEVRLIMKEMHERVHEIHIGGRALSRKILRVRYYCPSMLQDYARFVNHCEKCHIYAPFIHSPTELLHSIISPWLFYQWRSHILDPFPLAAGQLKFLIVVVKYFTK